MSHLRNSTPDIQVPSDLAFLLSQVTAGQEQGTKAFYELLRPGIRFYIRFHLGPQQLDERVADTFLSLLRVVRRSKPKDHREAMILIRTVVRDRVTAYLAQCGQRFRYEISSESGCTRVAQEAAISRITEAVALSALERDLLTRFYVKKQRPEQICREIPLAETDFKRLKAQLKTRMRLAVEQNPDCGIL